MGNVASVTLVWDFLKRNGPNTLEQFVDGMLSPGPMAIACVTKVNKSEMTPVISPSCSFVWSLINPYKESQELIHKITALILFALDF